MWLSKRRERILLALVKLYISTHRHVTSTQIGRDSTWAPSTIRKELQELENQGYLDKLHAASGRIPTNKGLKFYINRLSADKSFFLNRGTENTPLKGSDFFDVSLEALTELSTTTHNLGFVLLGSLLEFKFKEIRFLKVSPYKLIAVIKSDNNWNFTKSFFASRNYSQQELQAWAAILNREFAYNTLSSALKKIRNRIFKDRSRYLTIYHGLYRLLRNRDLVSAELIARGEENIFSFGIANPAEMKVLLQILEEKERFSSFVDDLLVRNPKSTEPVVIFGSEHPLNGINQLMVVLAGFFSKERKRLGNIGIIGPRYMEYSTVFARLHHLSAYFSTELSNH